MKLEDLVTAQTAAWWVLAFAFSALGAVHAMVWMLRRRVPASRTLADMHLRACSWWKLALFAPFAALGGPWLAALTAGVLVVAIVELTQAWRREDAGEEVGHGLSDITAFGLFALSGLALLPTVAASKLGGSPALLVWALVCVQLSDALQYVFGRLFGRRPLAARVSPKKTLEGFLLGAGAAVCAATLLAPLAGRSMAWGAVVALLLVCAGLAGGLMSSSVKRTLGIKDWGTWLAGHGGLLDRVDSVVLVSPVMLLALSMS